MVESLLNSAGTRLRSALVRELPENFDLLGARAGPKVTVDSGRARRQHELYIRVLREAGLGVASLVGAATGPEAAFVEDLGVVIGARHAILCRPSALGRSGEEDAVRPHLSRTFTLHEAPSGASLHGGDVIQVGDRILVGLSPGTNQDGVVLLERVAQIARLRVDCVTVRGAASLKSVCSPLGPEVLLHAAGAVSREAFPGFELIPAPESQGANVLAIGDRVIVPEEAPRTALLLERRGFQVVVVPLSEFLAVGAGPTRLSLRW